MLNWAVKTELYLGVTELLDRLSEMKVPMAILSNKPHSMTRTVVQRFLGDWKFQAVYGAREGVPKKPDPAGAQDIARELGLPVAALAYRRAGFFSRLRSMIVSIDLSKLSERAFDGNANQPIGNSPVSNS